MESLYQLVSYFNKMMSYVLEINNFKVENFLEVALHIKSIAISPQFVM